MLASMRFTTKVLYATRIMIDIAQLEENVDLARTHTPISERQMAELHERTESIASRSLWFRRDA